MALWKEDFIRLVTGLRKGTFAFPSFFPAFDFERAVLIFRSAAVLLFRCEIFVMLLWSCRFCHSLLYYAILSIERSFFFLNQNRTPYLGLHVISLCESKVARDKSNVFDRVWVPFRPGKFFKPFSRCCSTTETTTTTTRLFVPYVNRDTWNQQKT